MECFLKHFKNVLKNMLDNKSYSFRAVKWGYCDYNLQQLKHDFVWFPRIQIPEILITGNDQPVV